MFKDYCKVLDISHDASAMEIKGAFRKKTKETHPEFNSASDAEQHFISVNEAYDILIHTKTRELFEEDFNTHHNPETYAPYKRWLMVARERATVHARLPYKEFLRTKFYQSTYTSPYIVFLGEFAAAIIIIIIPYFLMTSEDEQTKFIGVFSLFLALPAGIYFLVQALSGFSASKKFKMPVRKERKTDAKVKKS